MTNGIRCTAVWAGGLAAALALTGCAPAADSVGKPVPQSFSGSFAFGIGDLRCKAERQPASAELAQAYAVSCGRDGSPKSERGMIAALDWQGPLPPMAADATLHRSVASGASFASLRKTALAESILSQSGINMTCNPPSAEVGTTIQEALCLFRNSAPRNGLGQVCVPPPDGEVMNRTPSGLPPCDLAAVIALAPHSIWFGYINVDHAAPPESRHRLLEIGIASAREYAAAKTTQNTGTRDHHAD